VSRLTRRALDKVRAEIERDPRTSPDPAPKRWVASESARDDLTKGLE
jgi:hypothetical protein